MRRRLVFLITGALLSLVAATPAFAAGGPWRPATPPGCAFATAHADEAAAPGLARGCPTT